MSVLMQVIVWFMMLLSCFSESYMYKTLWNSASCAVITQNMKTSQWKSSITLFFSSLTLVCRWILSPRKGHRHQVSPALKGPSAVLRADLWNIKASGAAETMRLERLSAVASGRPQREKASKVKENQCGWFTQCVCEILCNNRERERENTCYFPRLP